MFVFDAGVSGTRGNGRSHRRLAPRLCPGLFDIHTSGGAISFYRGGKLRISHFPHFTNRSEELRPISTEHGGRELKRGGDICQPGLYYSVLVYLFILLGPSLEVRFWS